VARKISVSRVKRDDFFSWIFVVSSLLLYLVWMALLLLITAIVDVKYAAALMMIMPITGILTLCYIRCAENWFQYDKLKKLKRNSPSAFNEMCGLRRVLLSTLFPS
ncbi:MAG: hypothetical protein ABI151_17665, partial [Chitinophagaceae bacterium]